MEMTLGTKIKRLREDKKYSQEKLAELLNVHAVTISKWENGAQIPRAEKLNELAKILGVSSEYLLKEDTNEDTISEYTKEQVNNKQGMATMSLGNGRNLAVPATPEGYAFLERIALAMVANGGKVHA